MAASSFSWHALRCWWAGSALEAGFGNGSGTAPLAACPPLRVAVAGCSLASLINPYGIQLHVHIFEYLRADWIKNIVQEFQAPTFRNEGQFQYEAVAAGGLIAIGFLLRKRRFTEALWMLFLAHASLISVRHAPHLRHGGGALHRLRAQRVVERERGANEEVLRPCEFFTSWARICRPASAGPACGRPCSFCFGALDAPLKWPRDFPSEMFPTAMIHQHADLDRRGRLLTTDQWGDYIIYSLLPAAEGVRGRA
jgi:hypothetical protein